MQTSSSSALVLVHGATGFTGRLICQSLAKRAIPFAISGRNKTKLAELSARFGGVESHVVDVTARESLDRAILGRKIVCAAAGPFVHVGEPMLAACANKGVHYVDTTGEQPFVKLAVERYGAVAESTGCSIVPAMAYEIAIADWLASHATSKLGVDPDELVITYNVSRPATSRGTRRSMLAMLSSDQTKQYVHGALVHEFIAEHVREVKLRGKAVTTVSFPSPEAIVTPTHTRAKTVRTFMRFSPNMAKVMHASRRLLPSVAPAIAWLMAPIAGSGSEGPDDAARKATRFDIVCEASGGGRKVSFSISGDDPYGLTGEIQAYAAQCAIDGKISARGVVAPSVAYPAAEAIKALQFDVREL